MRANFDIRLHNFLHNPYVCCSTQKDCVKSCEILPLPVRARHVEYTAFGHQQSYILFCGGWAINFHIYFDFFQFAVVKCVSPTFKSSV